MPGLDGAISSDFCNKLMSRVEFIKNIESKNVGIIYNRSTPHFKKCLNQECFACPLVNTLRFRPSTNPHNACLAYRLIKKIQIIKLAGGLKLKTGFQLL